MSSQPISSFKREQIFLDSNTKLHLQEQSFLSTLCLLIYVLQVYISCLFFVSCVIILYQSCSFHNYFFLDYHQIGTSRKRSYSVSGTVPVVQSTFACYCCISWEFDADATSSAKRRKKRIVKQPRSLDAMPSIAEDVDNNGG